MKMNPSFRRLCAFVILLSSTMAQARKAPELTVQGPRGERAPLSIVGFETKVAIFEDLAETTITVTFFNPSKRAIEGEFAMPLPPGATVSGYALDVNGKMRESSTVEKERARFAYESIKRKMIDPGFVEREKGNVYRTKIFPIPADGTKAVRVSYCEAINPLEGHSDYRLPLPELRIPSCRFTVTHLQSKAVTFPQADGITFGKEAPGLYLADTSKVKLPPELIIRLPKVADSFTIKEAAYSYVRKPHPKEAIEIIPQKTTTIAIIWDRSESGRQRDLTKEFAFLDRLFQESPKLTVRLSFLGLDLKPGGEFQIQDGDWSQLQKALRNVFYDGASDLSRITPANVPTFIFSDGHSHLSSLSTPWSSPISLIDSLGSASRYWQRAATRSGGIYRDLTAALVTNQKAGISRTFEIKENGRRNLTQLKNNENPEIVRQLRIHWAQRRLAELEAAFVPNEKEIIAHCKKHHLVSDFTSLIVLERFSDYVRYQIPPPEPDLLQRYQKEIAKKKSDPPSLRIFGIWASRKQWHKTFYPWQEQLLSPAAQKLVVWKNALKEAFQPSDLNPDVLQKVQEIEAKVGKLFKTRRESQFTKDQEYRDWLRELGTASKEIQEIRNLNAGVMTPDQKMAVAVNGFVKKTGRIRSDSSLTLLKAIEKAGGLAQFGSLSRVSVYRAGQRTTYNTLSKHYQDLPLKPGDLIVVEQENQDDSGGDSDPFSSADFDSGPIDHRNAPAVVGRPSAFEGKDGGDPFGSHDSSRKAGGVTIHGVPRASGLIFPMIEKEILAGEEPAETIYRKFRLKTRYSDHFYLSLGDLLLTRKNPELATQVLSNLIEESKPQPIGYRKWAYLLAKHEDWKGAQQVLNAIARHYPNDPAISLDQAWVASRLKELKATKEQLKSVIERLALKQRSSAWLLELASVEIRALTQKERLPVDLRIVIVTPTGQDLNLQISEPLDFVSRVGSWIRINRIGSRSKQENGIAEYAIRQALPGSYTIKYNSQQAHLIRLQIYRDWGKPTQKIEADQVMLLSASPQRANLASYEFTLE